jgi:hypothetical protein
MQRKRAKYTLRSTKHPSYRPSQIIDGYPISPHRDDLNIAYYLVYCPGPKHGRLYSQLPGYRNWGKEVRDRMTAQYAGLNDPPPTRSLQDTYERATFVQSTRIKPQLSTAPHGPAAWRVTQVSTSAKLRGALKSSPAVQPKSFHLFGIPTRLGQ